MAPNEYFRIRNWFLVINKKINWFQEFSSFHCFINFRLNASWVFKFNFCIILVILIFNFKLIICASK